MKYLILITTLFILLASSCSSQLPDYSKAKKISVKEANAQLNDIKDDILAKYDSLPLDALLNLCFTDFAFQYPEEYKAITLLPNGFDKKHLTSNSHFLALLNERGIDTSKIERYIYLRHPIEFDQ